TPEGVAVAKQTAEIGLIAHADIATKMAPSGGAAGPLGGSGVLVASGAVRADASGTHSIQADLWALGDSHSSYSALGAADDLANGATGGAALGLRAQLSRWSAGFGQRPLTRGALRA
ncbi:hypothetical protein, partial [Hydrogenophaga sp. RWCD_12]|uniref:hypothetical protein n=1 Tax=Hydrogenophaga sp. RWCD_12 TaxID=3391190 RepID=UPI00398531F1